MPIVRSGLEIESNGISSFLFYPVDCLRDIIEGIVLSDYIPFPPRRIEGRVRAGAQSRPGSLCFSSQRSGSQSVRKAGLV